ncbi:ATP-grasp domain-containing protein [Nocardia pseudobrasiliensis]|uniref:RimK-like ATP-grasp domain-containing protein n=1 Tax=Nocardia pseudobrasiliensis TaxID=45979 RepID=A0A370ICG0_9NOCA|nr:hypothetical protein [Nocardia pseudobrasiliensis]RDI68407.1 RimK-like ATP-grasp domain-containing protein [Nocardia pseudobrasiliensis]
MSDVVVMTDHASTEGSSPQLERAVEVLTGAAPVVVDARHFYSGGDGVVHPHETTPTLEVPAAGLVTQPAVLIAYEIPPRQRHRLARFQTVLGGSRIACLGADPQAWRYATDKRLAVGRFLKHGIPQMESVFLDRPADQTALDAFETLGRNVWARPAIGFGGRDVFHITSIRQLRAAVEFYAHTDCGWLLTRDAENFDHRGRRHQYRVVVLGRQVLRVCEHVQNDPDAPCNEAQGAHSTVLPPDALPQDLLDLAVAATAAVGLPFGGVDLVPESGGVVFEVNVHPVLDVPHGFETVTVPYTLAHLGGGHCDDRFAGMPWRSATDNYPILVPRPGLGE